VMVFEVLVVVAERRGIFTGLCKWMRWIQPFLAGLRVFCGWGGGTELRRSGRTRPPWQPIRRVRFLLETMRISCGMWGRVIRLVVRLEPCLYDWT
jgi:hypothetical protein